MLSAQQREEGEEEEEGEEGHRERARERERERERLTRGVIQREGGVKIAKC